MEGENLTGRPRKLLECRIRVITHDLVLKRRQILVDITNRSRLDVSHSIVKKTLHEVGFHNRITQNKFLYSDAHRQKRVEFASEHKK